MIDIFVDSKKLHKCQGLTNVTLCSRRNFFIQTSKNRRRRRTVGFKLMSVYLALAKVQPRVGVAYAASNFLSCAAKRDTFREPVFL
jgi:hypothetical protein